jgi:two-component system, NtrC family, sensor kinase
MNDPQVPVGQDVTPESLRESKAVAAREDLLNGVIHEIKNALAAILAHLDVLRLDRGDDEVVAHSLTVLIPQVRRLAGILDRAWTFARTPGDCAEQVDICENLRAIVELVSYHYRASGAEFDLGLPLALPRVTANPQRLQQVWLNVFNNAFHAICTKGPEHGRIGVKAWYQTDLRQVTVEITDTGRGMDEKTLAFLRDLSRLRGELPGTFAMGIRESARILAEHGGGFEIFSEPGVGTTVRVHLACAEVQDAQRVETQDRRTLKKQDHESHEKEES